MPLPLKYLTIAACMLVSLPGLAQEGDIRVRASGEWIVSNITPEEALARAYSEAKAAALRMAGIGEDFMSIEDAYTAGDRQAYGMVTKVEVNGSIVSHKVLSRTVENIDVGGLRVLVAKVVIDATVRHYDQRPDPLFSFLVNGIRDLYKEGEHVRFTILPSADGYLKIFSFEYDDSGVMLYPNRYEPGRVFRGGETVAFPLNDGVDYSLGKKDAMTQQEVNRMIFIYTKEDVPFTGEQVTRNSVLEWIASIRPDRRATANVQFFLVKNAAK